MDDANWLERLANIPSRIASIVDGWTDDQLRQRPVESEWSAADILAHLRASDDILAYRVVMLLTRDNPPLPAFDDRRWAEVVGYDGMSFRESLQTYRQRRAELIAALRKTEPEAWQRTGTHETRGNISLLQIVQHLVEHEEEHCQQLARIKRIGQGARP